MPWWFIFGLIGLFVPGVVFDRFMAKRRLDRRETKRALEEAARDRLHRLLQCDADVQEGLREVDRMFPLHEPLAPAYSVALPPPEYVQEAQQLQEARAAEDSDERWNAVLSALNPALNPDPFVAQSQLANQADARARLSALSNAATAGQLRSLASFAAQKLDEDRSRAQLRIAATPEASAKVFVESIVKRAVSRCQECERELRPSTWKIDQINHEVVFAWHCHRAETETRCDYMAFECGTEWSLRRAQEALVPPVLFTKADQSPVRRMDAEGLRVLAGGK